MIVANAGIGQLASLFWAVDTGRLLQAPGLFILGMILARGDYFSRGAGFWVKIFVGSFIASFLFYVAKTSAVDALQIILTMWYNMAFTGMLVSMFVILYQNDVFGRMTDELYQSVNHRKSDILSLCLRAGINVGHCMELRSGAGGNVCSNMVLPPVAQDA